MVFSSYSFSSPFGDNFLMRAVMNSTKDFGEVKLIWLASITSAILMAQQLESTILIAV